jgi:hypothetical protein
MKIKEAQMLEIGTFGSPSVKFISETVLVRENLSTNYLKILTQSIQRKKNHVRHKDKLSGLGCFILMDTLLNKTNIK